MRRFEVADFGSLLPSPPFASETPAAEADRLGVGADFFIARPLLSRAMTARDEEGGRGATGLASSVRMTTNFLMSPSGELRGSPAADEAVARLGAAFDDDTATGVLLAAAGVRAGAGVEATGIRGDFLAAAG